MKKRLVCLMAVLLLVLPVILSGCSSGKKEKDRPNLTTIALAMIRGENTTDAGVQAVEDAMNKVIESKFDVRIELQAYTEEEYYEIIETKFKNKEKEIEEEKAAEEAAKDLAAQLKSLGETTLPDTTEAETTSELLTYLDEDGNPAYVYPEAKENQVDIFLLTDMGKYYEMINKEWLFDMTESLEESHRDLKKQIHPNFMSAVNYDGLVFGIPNNHLVGETTYLLLNKEICTNQLDWAGTEFTTLASLNRYLKAVSTYCPDAVPLYNLPESTTMSITDSFSFFGAYYVPGQAEDASVGSPPGNVLLNGSYINYLTNCYNYRSNGWVVDGSYEAIPDDGQTYAAAFLKGGSNIEETYGEDYHVIAFSNKIASSYDLFRGVYCISSYSEHAETCMDIISMLTTDEELRNLFQYGAAGVTYTVDESTNMIVPNTEGEYVWDPNPVYTGNQFIMKQNSLMSASELALSANNWAMAKEQNQQMQLSVYAYFPIRKYTSEHIAARYEDQVKYDEEGNPTMTVEEFVAAYEENYTYTQKILDELEAYSAQVLEQINSFEEYVDETTGETVTFSDFLTEIRNEVSKNQYFVESGRTKEEDTDTLKSQYIAWRSGAADWS